MSSAYIDLQGLLSDDMEICVVFQGWKDVLLAWNPEQFGGVDEVRVPASKIWTPDIVLYN